jgi:peptide-methionine (R)-S-oxide reductase
LTLLLGAGAAALGLRRAVGAGASTFEPTRPDGVRLTAEEWRRHLNQEEFRVLRESGTERAFTGDLWNHHQDGIYTCAGCGLPLFDSSTKFDSGTGWPSFWQTLGKDAVVDRRDTSYGMVRVENVCGRCGGHLGHVFEDGPAPTHLRYCMNSASLDFVPRAEAGSLAGAPVRLGGWAKEGQP